MEDTLNTLDSVGFPRDLSALIWKCAEEPAFRSYRDFVNHYKKSFCPGRLATVSRFWLAGYEGSQFVLFLFSNHFLRAVLLVSHPVDPSVPGYFVRKILLDTPKSGVLKSWVLGNQIAVNHRRVLSHRGIKTHQEILASIHAMEIPQFIYDNENPLSYLATYYCIALKQTLPIHLNYSERFLDPNFPKIFVAWGSLHSNLVCRYWLSVCPISGQVERCELSRVNLQNLRYFSNAGIHLRGIEMDGNGQFCIPVHLDNHKKTKKSVSFCS